MTREDVKQQLAKHPLRWKKGKDPSSGRDAHTATIPINIDPGSEYNYVIEYMVKEANGHGDLELSFMRHVGSTGSSIAISFLCRIMYPTQKSSPKSTA